MDTRSEEAQPGEKTSVCIMPRHGSMGKMLGRGEHGSVTALPVFEKQTSISCSGVSYAVAYWQCIPMSTQE